MKMPKQKPRKKPQQSQSASEEDNEDDDDDENFIPTQASTSSQATQNLSPEELQRKVDEIAQYMLVVDHKKLPIKRLDIGKNVLKGNFRLFSKIFDLATKKIENVFGLKVTPIPNKKNMWILINQLEVSDEDPHIVWSSNEYSRTGFLMILLSLIFMNGNVIAENKLFQILEKLGIEQDKPHPVFGDVKKLITQEFVRQLYIEITRSTTAENPTFEFRWGARAFLEISKKHVFEFVCELYGNDSPEQWISQYQDVQRSESQQNNGTEFMEY